MSADPLGMVAITRAVSPAFARCELTRLTREAIDLQRARAQHGRQAANVLLIGGTVIAAAGAPRTTDRLARRGLAVETLDLSEIAKAEGAVTCCSVIVPHPARPAADAR